MFFVLFEVSIEKDCMDQYLALANDLKESLVNAEGFVRAERFSSLTNERKLLSLSVWESKEAIRQWRNREQHRISQQHGRDSVFESFTITVAAPIRTYSNSDRTDAPEDSNKRFGLEVE